MDDEDRVATCRRWLSYRDAADREPAAKVQSYDGSGGGGQPDGAMVPVIREVDLERAAGQLPPLQRAGVSWWRTVSFEAFRPGRETSQFGAQDRWALAAAQGIAAEAPVEWAAWEEEQGVVQERGPDGRFTRRTLADHATRLRSAIEALRRAAAEHMARTLGPDWG